MSDLGALAARLPAQVLGLLLALAPAVVATGTGSAVARGLATLAGVAGAGLVFGGLYHRVYQRSGPPAPEGAEEADEEG